MFLGGVISYPIIYNESADGRHSWLKGQLKQTQKQRKRSVSMCICVCEAEQVSDAGTEDKGQDMKLSVQHEPDQGGFCGLGQILSIRAKGSTKYFKQGNCRILLEYSSIRVGGTGGSKEEISEPEMGVGEKIEHYLVGKSIGL